MDINNQIEEYEVVETTPTGTVEHREAIVTDTGAETTRFVNRVIQFIWLFFGIIEALIALRIFLELIAANPASFFASVIYGITDLFLWPFAGLTVSPSYNGMVLNIPAIIAMVVYAIAAWIITSLIWIVFRPTSARSIRVSRRRID